MNILVVGADSFVGKNLCAQLENIKYNKARWYKLPEPIVEVCYCDDHELNDFAKLKHCNWDFVFYLTPLDGSKQNIDNLKIFDTMYAMLRQEYISSFVYCCYSCDKTVAEAHINEHKTKHNNSTIFIYDCPEIFGKWHDTSNLESVTSLCFRFANTIPMEKPCSDTIFDITYIDNVVDDLIGLLEVGILDGITSLHSSHVYQTSRQYIYGLLQSLDSEREQLKVPRVSDELTKAIYSTYLSYLSDSKVSYPLKMNVDERGSFTEFIKTNNHGQISVNVSKPGIIKGQHWHNNRVEKFLVVSGKGLLQQRRIGTDESGNQFPVLNTYVSGDKMEVVEVRPGFTHNLINLSEEDDLVTIIWGNDCFDPNHPDTYSEKV